MSKALAYMFLLISGLLGLWFVAGWVDGILRDGLSQTAYSLLHWPAVAITIALPLLAIMFLCVGLSLLSRCNRGRALRVVGY